MSSLTDLRRLKFGKSPADVDACLRDLVRSAYATVPLYRRLWEDAGVRAASFRGAADLPGLPIVTKEVLLSGPLETRLRRGTNPARTTRRSTSGSSGAPIEVHMSRLEFRFRQLSLLLAMWGDARWVFPLTVVEAGAWIPPDGSGALRVRRSLLGKIVYISRRIALSEQVQALVEARPTLLTGSPTSLQVIAAEITRRCLPAPRPRLLVARGEVLHPELRQHLSEVFGCRVVDYYNAQEIGNIARECACNTSRLHVNQDACVVEVVDEGGRPVSAGHEGSVVVTNLYNRTMPLVRYALRDRIVLERDTSTACECGRRGLFLTTPAGRDDDLIVLPDGQRVSPRVIDDLVIGACRSVGLDTEFTRGVRGYQIVQESPRHLTVLFEASEPLPPVLGETLGRDVLVLHPEFSCDVERVFQIEAEASGKRRRVISRIGTGV